MLQNMKGGKSPFLIYVTHKSGAAFGRSKLTRKCTLYTQDGCGCLCRCASPANRARRWDCSSSRGTTSEDSACSFRSINGIQNHRLPTPINAVIKSDRNEACCLINGQALYCLGRSRSNPTRSVRSTIGCVFSDRSLRCSSQRQAFCHLRSNCVILISRQSHGRQNTNDRHHDHQFDQGETLLQIRLHSKLLVENRHRAWTRN